MVYILWVKNQKLKTNITGGYRSGSSSVEQKESIMRAELKRCISIERRWDRNEVSRGSPDKEVNRRPTSLKKFRVIIIIIVIGQCRELTLGLLWQRGRSVLGPRSRACFYPVLTVVVVYRTQLVMVRRTQSASERIPNDSV